MQDWPALPTHFTLKMRYLMRGPKNKGTVILLHGYQDHAMSMTRRMGWLTNDDLPFQILAVNAPFPVPIWKADGYIEAYSWYFRDTSRNLMIVDPADTAIQLAELIHKVLPPGEPLIFYGFSQGGYLAPFLAKHFPDVKAIIAAGSGYPLERYQELNKTLVFGLHGSDDERIPVEASAAAHKKLIEAGFKGEFVVLPGLKHKVDPILDPFVRRFVSAAFRGAA